MTHRINSPKIVLDVYGLTKVFNSRSHGGMPIKALDGLSLQVYEGEILGILGPNGAGKTTFLNTLATLLLADRGRIEILGIESTARHFSAIRRLINMSSGYPNYAWSLTIEENLKFYGRLYGLAGKSLEVKVREVMELFALIPFAKRCFDELSSGTKQRLSLAKALLNDPQILFLDEPTIGLDPDVALKTRQVILDVLQQRKMTVLLTSHNMPEVEALCARVAFIQQGRIVKLAPVDELKRLHNTDDLEEIFIRLASVQHAHPPPLEPQPLAQATAIAPKPRRLSDMRKWANRAFAFSYRSAIFARRNLFVMTDLFFWPMVSLISIGLMAKFIHLGEGMLAFVMTGALAAGVLQIAQLDVGYTVLYELWSKSLKHTLLAPVGASEGICGTWVVGMIRGLAAFVLLAFAAQAGFGFHLPGAWTTVMFLLGLYMCALLLGMLVNILILSFGQKVEITAWMFAYVFMILCGIYYPVDILPPLFQVLAQLVPVTYFLEYFRHSYGFHMHNPHPLRTGFALALVYFWLTLMLLRGAYTRARRKGVIVRLSE